MRGIRIAIVAATLVAAACLAAPVAAVAAPPSVNATIVAWHNTASAGWYNVPVRIAFRDISWDDPIMGGTYDIAAIDYTRNGGPSVSAASTSTLRLRCDGRYMIEAQGTWGGFADMGFGIDRTSPVSASDARSAYTGTALITLTVSDATSGPGRVWYVLDGASKVAASVSASNPCVAVSAGPGTHRLIWGSSDAAGNAECESHVVTFAVGAVAAPTRVSAPRVRIRGKRVAFHGSISRSTGSKSVRLVVERKRGTHWRVVGRYWVKVRSEATTYASSHALPRGQYRVVAQVGLTKSKTTFFRRR